MRAGVSLALALLVAGWGVTGCAHGSVLAGGTLADMERVRTGPGAHEGAELAPQEYAHAEQERALARKAHKDGDNAAATLYAERAIASYSRALVLARLARATREATDATAALAHDTEQARSLSASRAEVEKDGDELEKKLRVAEQALAPAASGNGDAAREAARLVATRALAAEARLLCGAARLLDPNASGLAAAEKDAASIDGQLEPGSAAKTPALIDTAARARTGCLAALTSVRRAADTSRSSDADQLLAELSASGDLAPSRDERGVVVTLRGIWKGNGLTPEGEKQLRDLGRVAGAHAAFAVQVVVHDAVAPGAAEAAADAQRGSAAAAAIAAGGAPAAKVKSETAGAKLPVVDPADVRHRARNARLEVVFVAPGG